MWNSLPGASRQLGYDPPTSSDSQVVLQAWYWERHLCSGCRVTYAKAPANLPGSVMSPPLCSLPDCPTLYCCSAPTAFLKTSSFLCDGPKGDVTVLREIWGAWWFLVADLPPILSLITTGETGVGIWCPWGSTLSQDSVTPHFSLAAL